ncbi:MAG: hypothetical protein IJ493_07175 [Clostridia bacterium]|nr:hypothetical protein [Clostridia bacterium]
MPNYITDRCPTDAAMLYPRICAHRGFSTVAPENTLPAYGAAIGLGADEIEFDLWQSKDGAIISSHDPTLDRVSDGHGDVRSFTLEELRQYDFGIKKSPHFAGLRIVTFEEILQRFAKRTIMNIHIKQADINIGEIMRLLRKYDAVEHCYFMSQIEPLLVRLKEEAPEVTRCFGGNPDTWDIVERAVKYDCKKIQLFKPAYNQQIIDDAHAHGIICNIYWSDEPEETRKMLDMGMDCILSNDFQIVNETAKSWIERHKS